MVQISQMQYKVIASELNRTFAGYNNTQQGSFRPPNKPISFSLVTHATGADSLRIQPKHWETQTAAVLTSQHKLVNLMAVDHVSVIYLKVKKCFDLPIQNIVIVERENLHFQAKQSYNSSKQEQANTDLLHKQRHSVDFVTDTVQ